LLDIAGRHGRYSGFLYATTAGQFLSSVISGTFGFLFKFLVDLMIGSDMSGFISAALVLGGLFLANVPLLGVRTHMVGRYSSSVLRDIRRDIAKKATSLEISQIDATHSCDFVSKANNDLGQIGVFFSTHLQIAIRLIISGLVSLILMLVLNWQLTLITFVIVPVFLYITVLIGKPLKDLVVKRNEKLACFCQPDFTMPRPALMSAKR
jgi:ATP-binding cassette subfamily B protein AbcA/BmrA